MAESTPKSEVGVLVDDDIRELLRDGHISAAVTVDDFQVQPASLDLRLGCVRVCVCVCVCVHVCMCLRHQRERCVAVIKRLISPPKQHVWGVNAGHQIFRRDGNTWTNVPGLLKCISAADDGSVYGCNAADDIYKWENNTWVQVQGESKKI